MLKWLFYRIDGEVCLFQNRGMAGGGGLDINLRPIREEVLSVCVDISSDNTPPAPGPLSRTAPGCVNQQSISARVIGATDFTVCRGINGNFFIKYLAVNFK